MGDFPGLSALRWAWARGFRFLWILDTVALGSILVGIGLVRFGSDWPTYPTSHYAIGFSLAVLIQVLVNYAAGLYAREPLLGSSPTLSRVVVAMTVGVAADASLSLVFDRYLMPRLHLGFYFVFGVLALGVNREISWSLGLRRRGSPKVILIGSRDARDKIRPRLEEVRSGSVLVSEFDAVSEVELPGADGALTDVILADPGGYGAIWPEPLASLASRGITVHQRVDALSTLVGLRSVREIGGVPFVVVRSGLLLTYQRRIKRWFDLALVLVAAPVWLLVICVVAAYIRVVAGDGVLYRQRRTGVGGSEFTMLKFRTMRHNAEASTGPVLASLRDDRVIPALRFLRRSRLDELPQLINVIRGEMSLVGPRPERPELVARFSSAIMGYELRHQTPPGITGLAQLRGHYETDPEHKLGYDLQYQASWNLLQDAQLLFLTPFAMLRWRARGPRLASSARFVAEVDEG